MFKLLMWSVMTGALFAVVMWFVVYLISIPEVYESWNTGQCVAVISVDPSHSCDNPPTKFHHKWVQ